MTQATELRELATLLDVSSGNVGIGLPSGTASNKLVISDGVRTSAAITAGTTALEIARTGGGDVGILINKDTAKWLIGVDNSDGNDGPLRFLYGAYNAAAHPGFGTAADGLNLAYNGNVGIGVKTPSAKLHINSSSLDATGIGLQNNSRYMGIEVEGGGLRVKDVSAGLVERFRIASSGDVTIGDITAEHKLDVDGSIGTRQVRHSIAPTLNLDFIKSKELDSRITFYRDSIATYYDSKGILRYANHNEPRFDHDPVTGKSKGLLIEESRTNLVPTVPNSTSGNWVISQGSLVRNATKAPDGTYSAYGLITTGSPDHAFNFQTTQTITHTTVRTVSVYAKAGNQPGIQIRNMNETGTFSYNIVNFTLSGDGSTTQGGTHSVANLSNSIEHVGNGWYRCVVSNSFTDSSVTRSQLQVQGYNGSTHSYTGTNQLDFYVWGPQLESASFSTSFIPSDTRFTSRASVATYYDETGILRKAPVNGARYGYEYDGRKWVETGLILENAATNTVSNSDFQEGWAFPNARHSYGNAITAPDGSQIRSVVTNSTYHLIRQSNVFDNTSAGTATLSFWAKAVSSTGTESVGFDFGDMAGSAYNSSTSQSLTSEWKRFTYTQTWTANQTAHNFLDFNLGNNTEVAIWGVQVETGNIATSYIPTYGVDVTRSADVVTSTAYTRERDYAIGHNLDKLLPSINEGSSVNMSAYVETSGIGHNTGFQTVGYLEDTSDFANNYIQLFSAYGGNNTIATAYNIGGTAANFGNWTSTASDITLDWKIAIGIEDGSQAAAANGTLGTLRSNTIPSGTFDILYIGNGYAGGRTMNGHIKKLSFYDQKLANAELQALTENN